MTQVSFFLFPNTPSPSSPPFAILARATDSNHSRGGIKVLFPPTFPVLLPFCPPSPSPGYIIQKVLHNKGFVFSLFFGEASRQGAEVCAPPLPLRRAALRTPNVDGGSGKKSPHPAPSFPSTQTPPPPPPCSWHHAGWGGFNHKTRIGTPCSNPSSFPSCPAHSVRFPTLPGGGSQKH